jgi:hypothetical protein
MSRDRGASYLKGANKGAPGAKQMLDRWHLLKNLGEVLQKSLAQHLDVLQEAAHEAPPAGPSSSPSGVVSQTPTPGASRLTVLSKCLVSQQVVRYRPLRSVPASLRGANLRLEVNSVEGLWRCISKYMNRRHRVGPSGPSSGICTFIRVSVGKYVRMEHFVDQRHNPHGSSVEPYRAYLEQRWRHRMYHGQNPLAGTVRPRLYRQLEECLPLHTPVVHAREFALCQCASQTGVAVASDRVADQVAALAGSRRAFGSRCQLLPGRLSPLPGVGTSGLLGSQVRPDGAQAPARPARWVGKGKPVPAQCKNCAALHWVYGKNMQRCVLR